MQNYILMILLGSDVIQSVALGWFAASMAWSMYRAKREDASRKEFGTEVYFLYNLILFMTVSVICRFSTLQSMLFFFPINFIYTLSLYKQNSDRLTGLNLVFIFSGYFMFIPLVDMIKPYFPSSAGNSFLGKGADKIAAFAQFSFKLLEKCGHFVLAMADAVFSDKLVKMLDESSFGATFVMFFIFFAWQVTMGSNVLLSGVICSFTVMMLIRDLGVWPNVFASFLDNVWKIGLVVILFSGQPVGWLFGFFILGKVIESEIITLLTDYLVSPLSYLFSSKLFYNPEADSEGSIWDKMKWFFHCVHNMADSANAKSGKNVNNKNSKPAQSAHLKSVLYGLGLFLAVPFRMAFDFSVCLLKNVFSLVKWPFIGVKNLLSGSSAENFGRCKQELLYFMAGGWQFVKIPFVLFADLAVGMAALASQTMFGLTLFVLSAVKVICVLCASLPAVFFNWKETKRVDQKTVPTFRGALNSDHAQGSISAVQSVEKKVDSLSLQNALRGDTRVARLPSHLNVSFKCHSEMRAR